ncbi:MAG: hypothetical protein WDW38_010768 [Sanguina aurantia]
MQHDVPRLESRSAADIEHFTSEHKLHALIIASASTYFRVHLKTNVGRDSTSDPDLTRVRGPFRYELHEQVDPDQIEAAAAVLELMYRHQLPHAGVSTRTLLSMLQVADRWMAPGCVSIIHKALASLESPSMSLDDTAAIYAIPPALLDAPNFAPVLRGAKVRLLKLFGNVVDVVACPSLTQQLLQLPHAAVLSLLSSEELSTDCEDSVLMLLSWWLEGAKGEGCCDQEVEELREAVRYSRLSTTYLVQVLHQLPKLRPTECQTLQLMEFQRMQGQFAELYAHEEMSIPEAWLRPARPCPEGGAGQSVTLSLDIPRAQLVEHLAGVRAMKAGGPVPAPFSVSKLFRGLNLTLILGSNTNSHALFASILVCPQLPAWNRDLALPRGIPSSFNINMQTNLVGAGVVKMTSSKCYSRSNLGLGWINFVQRVSKMHGDPLDPSWWDPFLVEGVVKMSADFRDERDVAAGMAPAVALPLPV